MSERERDGERVKVRKREREGGGEWEGKGSGKRGGGDCERHVASVCVTSQIILEVRKKKGKSSFGKLIRRM